MYTQGKPCSDTRQVLVINDPSVWTRGALCWTEVLPEEGAHVLVVAHNAINQAMIGSALGLGPEYFRRLEVSNCGLTTLAFTPGGKVFIEQFNQTPSPPINVGWCRLNR